MKMRATDGTGQVMTEDDRSPLPDGATGWPPVTSKRRDNQASGIALD